MLFSLALPFIVIAIILVLIGIIINNNMPLIIILLLTNINGSWTDIYMFFYLVKMLNKNSIVYGNRYKIMNNDDGVKLYPISIK